MAPSSILLALVLAGSSFASGQKETAVKLPAAAPVLPANVPVLDLQISGLNLQVPVQHTEVVRPLGPVQAVVPQAAALGQEGKAGPLNHPALQPTLSISPEVQNANEQQVSEGARRFDGALQVSKDGELGFSAESLAPVHGGDLVSPEGVLGGAQAISAMEKAGRNWYYKSIKHDAGAVDALRERLDRNRLPAKSLEKRLLVDAAITGVEITKVVGVYRYGSSVWGHKSQPPSDMDVLVVVEGTAHNPSKQTREAMSVVSEEDPKSFALYLNEESASQPGQLPLNVTVVTREYIRDFVAKGEAPEELSSMGIGDLTGDWGHGVLVYGEDALAAVKPTPFQLVRGARDTVRNAGGFMENYIFKSDGRKAQSMSKPSSGGMAQDELQKLPPKVYLRHLEAQLRMLAALELQGRDKPTTAKVLGTDPREAFRRYLTGEDFPNLPSADHEAISRKAIETHNAWDGIFDRLKRLDMSPAQVRRERLRNALVGAGLLAVLAGFFSFFIGGWSAITITAAVVGAAALAGTAGLSRAPPARASAPAASAAVVEAVADSTASHEALVDAYQDGALDALGASPRQKALLEDAARQAVAETLAKAHFKVYYKYGFLLPTLMYEAPELPGVLLKTYGSPFYAKGRAWKGYNLAKRKLGDLFAETTIAENVEVEIEGKKKRIPWVLVQEKLKMEGLSGYRGREIAVLNGMFDRGVLDNDSRPRGFEVVEATRNLGETAAGKLVHLDADFFAEKKDAAEGPKRVRDPPALRAAIRAAQLAALAADAGA